MTISTPFKIIIACFAVAAVMATVMTGSSSDTSAGLKGSARKLQFGFAGVPPANPTLAVNNIFFKSNAIITALNPAISAAPPPPPPGAATIATNTVAFQSAQIFQTFNP
jgi:hypothetical protein